MTSGIRKNGFFLVYVVTLIGVYSLDCLTTFIALNQGLGWEMNPLVDTTSFFSIFFDPIVMMLFAVAITTVYIAEKKRRNNVFSNTDKDGGALFVLLILSFFLIFNGLLATVNNTMVIFGLFSPVGEFTRLLPYYNDYPFLSLLGQLMLFKSIVALLFVRFFWAFVQRRYKIGGQFYWFRKPKQTQS